MSTVREVIDRLGTPPAEICADWMWQLGELDAGHESKKCAGKIEIAEYPLPVRPGPSHAAWSLIAVDPHGVLSPYDPSSPATTLTNTTLEELTAELQRWSQAGAVDSWAATCEPTLSIRKKRQRRPSPAPRYLLPAAILLTAAMLSGLWLSSRMLSSGQSRSTAMAPTSQSSAETSSFSRDDARLNTDDFSQEASQIVELNYPPQTSASLSNVEVPPESLLEQSIRLEQLEQDPNTVTSSASGFDLAPVAEANISLASAQSPAKDVMPPAQLAKSSEETMIDVLGELVSLAQSAEVEPVTQVVASTGHSRTDDKPVTADSAPLGLAISPANQLQTFDKTFRPRQPAWKLRLSVSEGFTAEPTEAQVIEGRDRAGWTVREVKKPSSNQWFHRDDQRNSPNQTQVMVQAQLANHRQTSLRWRIVAGANDFPGLAIPLDPLWLDRAQSGLRTQAQSLQAEIERTQILGRVDGLPSEARSALTARRRALETQHKLATRWLEIVADANQFPAWLDGQLNVHVELLDAAHSPAPALLRFGTP